VNGNRDYLPWSIDIRDILADGDLRNYTTSSDEHRGDEWNVIFVASDGAVPSDRDSAISARVQGHTQGAILQQAQVEIIPLVWLRKIDLTLSNITVGAVT
tara:strand:- start:728 stop:1027 length:300 start_codon:yes stop_codon:yes gene_type:complete